jgi:hypothetical protein
MTLHDFARPTFVFALPTLAAIAPFTVQSQTLAVG